MQCKTACPLCPQKRHQLRNIKMSAPAPAEQLEPPSICWYAYARFGPTKQRERLAPCLNPIISIRQRQRSFNDGAWNVDYRRCFFRSLSHLTRSVTSNGRLMLNVPLLRNRSEERRVGKEC